MEVLPAIRVVAALRAAIGAALTFGTEPLLRLLVRERELSGPLLLFARTVGIRDLIFGLGALSAATDPERASEIHRWLWAWLANEIADVVAGVTASRHVGRCGAIGAAAAPLPFVAADIWAIRRLAKNAFAATAT